VPEPIRGRRAVPDPGAGSQRRFRELPEVFEHSNHRFGLSRLVSGRVYDVKTGGFDRVAEE